MREMKDSGIEWIGEIPNDWDISKIKFVADFEPTCNFENISPEDRIAYAPMECIKQGFYEARDALYEELSHSLTPFQNGDIVMAKVTPCFENGNIAIMNELPSGIGLGSSELFVFRAKNIVAEYLFYWLQNSDFIQQACSTMTGVGGLKRVSPFFCKNCEIHIPPYNEQCRIADYLDRKCSQIDAIIARQQEVIERLKAYKLSIITEAVTKGLNPNVSMKDSGVEWIGEIPDFWNVVPLKTCSDILPGYAFSSDDFDTENGTALLRGINVTPNGVRWEDVVYWNKPITEQLRAFELVAGDIVVGLDRPWVSGGTRVCWVTQKDLPALLLQRVCRIRAKENIDSRWIYHWIASKSFKKALSIETTGVSVPHISTKQIGQFNITLPPIEVQRQICDILEAKHYSIDKMVSKKQAIIDKLTEYKKSLIYEVVTGKKEV